MRVAVYDPYTTFPAFVEHAKTLCDKLEYIPAALSPLDREKLHAAFDVVWYEFCTPDFADDTRRIRRNAYTVCRLHSYELFTDLPLKPNWDKVELLMLTDPYIRDMFVRKQRMADFPPMEILFNGVDLCKFKKEPLAERNGKNIAVVGWINHKKNLPMALQCLDAVRGGGYHLHFFGETQDRRYDFYLKHITGILGLDKYVHFHGKVPHDNLPEVLRQMDFIASFSLFESFGQSIMEGIACGCVPLIHAFPGAYQRFGESHLFATANDFRRLVEEHAPYPHDLGRYSMVKAKDDLGRIFNMIRKGVANE